MENPEKRSFTIEIPEIHWKFFLSVRFFLFVLCVAVVSFGVYWYKIILPYFWIENAKVSAHSVQLGADFQGKIAQLGFEIGEAVRKGDLLFSLETGQVAMRQKELEKSVEELAAEILLEREKMDLAMDAYLAALQDTEINMNDLSGASRHLEILEEAQGKSEKLSSTLASYRLELQTLGAEGKKFLVEAPFSGVVAKRLGNVGSFVSKEDSVYEIYDPQKMWIETEIPENKIAKVRLGGEVLVSLFAYPGKKFQGTISWIGPMATAAGVPIRISLENVDVPLKPGYSAKLGIKTRI